MTLGTRLAETIAFLRMSQNEFAARANSSGSYVSDVVRDLKRPGSDFLASIGETFGISIDWLVLGRGSMFGRADVDVELFRIAYAIVCLVKRAAASEEPAVCSLRDALFEGGALDPAMEHRLSGFVNHCTSDDQTGVDAAAAVIVYGAALEHGSAPDRLRHMVISATQQLKLTRRVDVLAALARHDASGEMRSKRSPDHSPGQQLRGFSANVVNAAAGNVVQYGPQVVNNSSQRTKGRARRRN